MPQEPPHRGIRFGRVVDEPNEARGRPHTPVPPAELRDATSTAPPPAMPMDPPRHLRGPGVVVPRLQRPASVEWLPPSDPTLVGMPPPREKLDSREISTDTLLAELARESEEKRAARLEARELRQALDASRSTPHAEASPPSSAPPKRADWAKMFYGLGGAFTLFLGGLGTYLGARAVGQESAVTNVEAKTSAQATVTADLTPRVTAVERDASSCKAWARAQDDYMRQVFGKLGVVIPPQPNAPPVEAIKAVARVRKPNAITNAPLLEVQTPPPPLP